MGIGLCRNFDSFEEFEKIKKECGCIKCDCDAFSQDSYHKGCHTYGLFDQEGDTTNSNESGGLYDESTGPSINGSHSRKNAKMTFEDFEFLNLALEIP